MQVKIIKNNFFIIFIIFACSNLYSMSIPGTFAELDVTLQNDPHDLVNKVVQGVCTNLEQGYKSKIHQEDYSVKCKKKLADFQNNKMERDTLIGDINQLIRIFNTDLEKFNQQQQQPASTSYDA